MNDESGVPAITIRNRHTGQEKQVSEETAKIIMDTFATGLGKDWEVLKTPQPTPGVVIQFQKEKVKELQKDDEGVFLDDKKETKKAIKEPKPRNTTELSIKKLNAELEFLTEAELRQLLKDERVTARKIGEAELLKRGL